jgi:hypothetical protein
MEVTCMLVDVAQVAPQLQVRGSLMCETASCVGVASVGGACLTCGAGSGAALLEVLLFGWHFVFVQIIYSAS